MPPDQRARVIKQMHRVAHRGNWVTVLTLSSSPNHPPTLPTPPPSSFVFCYRNPCKARALDKKSTKTKPGIPSNPLPGHSADISLGFLLRCKNIAPSSRLCRQILGQVNENPAKIPTGLFGGRKNKAGEANKHRGSDRVGTGEWPRKNNQPTNKPRGQVTKGKKCKKNSRKGTI